MKVIAKNEAFFTCSQAHLHAMFLTHKSVSPKLQRYIRFHWDFLNFKHRRALHISATRQTENEWKWVRTWKRTSFSDCLFICVSAERSISCFQNGELVVTWRKCHEKFQRREATSYPGSLGKVKVRAISLLSQFKWIISYSRADSLQQASWWAEAKTRVGWGVCSGS